MNNDFLAELVAHPWAMEPKALEAFLARVRAGYPADNRATIVDGGSPSFRLDSVNFFGDDGRELRADVKVHERLASFGDDAPKRSRMTIAGGVARIPVSGVLLKKVPAWLRWFGVDATSYSDIQDDMTSALSDDGVKEIVLSVDSPGGQVAGVHEAGEAIHAARQSGKRVTAEVNDLAASAAYWLASQAHRITAGPNAQIGSIGVYSVYVDSSKAAEDEGYKVHVVSSGPHKGAGVPGAPITPTQLEGFQKVIDGMAQNFKDAVSRGRGRGKDKVAEWATGQVWLAADATRMGLIDGITTPRRNEGAAGVRPAAAFQGSEIKEETMADESKAAQEALASERKRAGDIKAAFPRHLEFALAHIEKGSTLIEAKVAFNDVLESEAKSAKAGQAEAEQKLADAKKAPVPSPGASAVPLGSAPAGAGSQDFMVLVQTHMKDTGCTKLQAMSAMCKAHPELYRAFDLGSAVAAGK